MRAAPQRSSRAMRNNYRKPPFYRRHWFLGVLLTLLICAFVGSIAAYFLHLQFLDKANSFDMTLLGKMESASTIFDRHNVTFGYIYEQKREPVPLKLIPETLQHAVVSAEDNRFYTHGGSDFRGILRAAIKNLRSSKIRQGASTVTQQLARNTFPLKGRTFSRKVLEIYVAHRIETTLTKEQIMEYYLNRIYLGSGLYGVQAASKGYFGKPAIDMTLGECAMLAGLIRSPNNLSPWSNKVAARNARNFVLGRMQEEGYVTRDQYLSTVEEPLSVIPRVLASSDSYALEAIRQLVVAQVGLDRAVSEGLKIYTTIDARIQKAAEDALRGQLDEVERRPVFQNHQTYAQYSDLYHEEEKRAAALAIQDPKAAPANIHNALTPPEYLQGAAVVLNNSDGGVLALVGGRDFKHSEFNRATNVNARRPAGTAFTPFVFAAAYQQGIFPGRLFLDQVMDNRQVMVGGQNGILGEWGVERSGNHYDGPIPAAMALVKGKNAATVRVGNEVGLDKVLALVKRAGIKSPLREYPATFLGGSEVGLTELALAYTSFPNSGWHPATHFLLTKIEDADGEILFQAKLGSRARTVDEGPAYQIHSALAENMKSGPSSAAAARYGLKASAMAVGKSGSSYNFSDALYAGYNSDVTCAIWTGFDKPSTIYRGAFGSELALPIWTSVMNAAATYMPPKTIQIPKSLKKVDICAESGDLATARCFETVDGERRSTVFTTYATALQMPKLSCPVHGGGRSSIAALAAASRNAQIQQASLATGASGGDTNTPRKAIAVVVNTDAAKIVSIKGPTVVGVADKDPYGTVQPIVVDPGSDLSANPDPAGENKASEMAVAIQPSTAQTAAEKTPRRAVLPVAPVEPDTSAAPVKIEPPDPLQFN